MELEPIQPSSSDSPTESSPVQKIRCDPEIIQQVISSCGGVQGILKGLMRAMGGEKALLKQLAILTNSEQLEAIRKLKPAPIKLRVSLGPKDYQRLKDMSPEDVLQNKVRDPHSEWQGVYSEDVHPNKEIIVLHFKTEEAKAKLESDTDSVTRLLDLCQPCNILGDEFQVVVEQPKLNRRQYPKPEKYNQRWAEENGIGISRSYWQGNKLVLSLAKEEDAHKVLLTPFSLFRRKGFVR